MERLLDNYMAFMDNDLFEITKRKRTNGNCMSCEYEKPGLKTVCGQYRRIPDKVQNNGNCDFYKEK